MKTFGLTGNLACRAIGGFSILAAIAAFELISCGRASADTTITEWNFQNNAIAVNNSPAPSTGVGTASSIGMDVYPTPNVGVTTDDILAGKNSDTAPMASRTLLKSGASAVRPVPTAPPTDGQA